MLPDQASMHLAMLAYDAPRLHAPCHGLPAALTRFNGAQATVEDLKAAFAKAKPKYYVSRQRFTIQATVDASGSVPLTADRKPLSEYGVADGATLLFKDLGPQVCCMPGGLLVSLSTSGLHAIHDITL